MEWGGGVVGSESDRLQGTRTNAATSDSAVWMIVATRTSLSTLLVDSGRGRLDEQHRGDECSWPGSTQLAPSI